MQGRETEKIGKWRGVNFFRRRNLLAICVCVKSLQINQLEYIPLESTLVGFLWFV